jgi:hypothetical protein
MRGARSTRAFVGGRQNLNHLQYCVVITKDWRASGRREDSICGVEIDVHAEPVIWPADEKLFGWDQQSSHHDGWDQMLLLAPTSPRRVTQLVLASPLLLALFKFCGSRQPSEL